MSEHPICPYCIGVVPRKPTMEQIDVERTKANELLETARGWETTYPGSPWVAVARKEYETQCDKVLVMLYDYRGEKHT